MNKDQLKLEISKYKKALNKLEKAEAQQIRDTQITPTEEGKLLARYREVKALLIMAENEYEVARLRYEGLKSRRTDLRSRKLKLEEKAEVAGVQL
jgi:hypothetical protein